MDVDQDPRGRNLTEEINRTSRFPGQRGSEVRIGPGLGRSLEPVFAHDPVLPPTMA